MGGIVENKKILITGITSMDGSHLAEYLLPQGYKIFGLKRRSSTDTTWRINKIINDIEIVCGDLTDGSSLNKAVHLIKPDFIFNMAAQSFVKASWDSPESTFDINATGLIRLLEAVRNFGNKDIRILQCSSSEMFGKVQETPQTESTKFYPRSIYGASKCSAHWIATNYRESYNMFISCAISFNHTSHRRGLEFVERKISYNVAKIALALSSSIELGNLEPKRDWSWAPEFCEMFWKMLQIDKPDDFVLASGETHSVREFLDEAFKSVGIFTWEHYIKQNPKFMRPAEVDLLIGNPMKAKRLLGFIPKKSFKEIVAEMVSSDMERLKSGKRYD